MSNSFFAGATLDDVMHDVIKAIIENGDLIAPSRGEAVELAGVLLEVENPRTRLSRTETRGKPFSCLGELCWYLAQTNALEFIRYYLPEYEKSAEGEILYGGYGPRLFRWNGVDQVANVTALLRRNRTSRRAVIQLFDASDLLGDHKDIPCTCALQFMIRSERLNMMVFMRSNDVFLGLPHDVFSFTMLQEILARTLSVELGSYKHAVGSLHLYKKHRESAQQFLNEGFQSTEMAMPPMPTGDQGAAISTVLKAEAAIRSEGECGDIVESLEPYWRDLVNLLLVLRYWKERRLDEVVKVRAQMSSSIYDVFIDKKLESAQQP